MFQRLSVCLRADTQDKARGEHNQKLWLYGVTCTDEELEYAAEGTEPWSSERILKRYVKSDETANAIVKAHKSEDREPERDGAKYAHPNTRTRPRNDQRQSQAGAVMAATNYDESWIRESESPSMVGAVPIAPHPAPSAARGPGREPAPTHQREPPPTRLTPEEYRIRKWGRDCGPPAGNKGHPTGKTWDEKEWRYARIDYEKVCRLAANPQAQAAINRFVPMDKRMNSARKVVPKKDETGQWGPDSCLFCAHRPLEHRQMNESQRIQSGSGRGNHQPTV